MKYSLKQNDKVIFSSDIESNLISYLINSMTKSEVEEADESFSLYSKQEYGGHYFLCLLEHCERLNSCSIIVED